MKKTFASEHPDLVPYWSDKNDVRPDEVGPQSTHVVLWEVPGFDPFEKQVRQVSRKGYAAPIQRPKNAVADEPALADEFADDNRLPASFVGRSDKSHYNWNCRDCGTRWTAAPFTRWKGMSGCPSCAADDKAAERAAIQPLLDEKERIAQERKQLNNLKFRLRKVHTQLKAEQKKRDNAEAAEQRRIERLRTDKSSLGDVRPDIAAELVGVDPFTISAKSGVKQHWKGRECKHEWVATPHDRVGKDSGCPVCSGRVIETGHNDMLTMFPDIAAEWSGRNLLPVESVSPGSNTPGWWECKECKHEWVTQPNYRCFQGYGCPRCFKTKGRSQGETDLADYIASRIGEDRIERRKRGVLGSQRQIDVFVPSMKIGFEYNGLYWHSEGYAGRTYHRDKTEEAREAGIRLIHVWEDDWENKRAVMERFIDSVLGVDTRPKIGARNCEVVDVSRRDADEFLDSNHVQGPPRITGTSIGLTHDGELVAVLLAKRNATGYELTRFATSATVRGGFTRLLSRLEERVRSEGGGVITTFSDNSYSDGDLYARSGFIRDGELAPDYSYAQSHGQRSHKFNYRKKRFKTNPNLKYEEGLTERELAQLNGLFRVYDAGKVRWVKVVGSAA